MESKTLGEKRVRTEFNPANSSVVDQLKQKSAELINLCSTIKTDEVNSAEVGRLVALAQTAYEQGAMWAVKAATA